MSKEHYNVAVAFTEWLDKEKKDYLLIVKDIDGEGVNICAVNGNTDELTLTIASGMIDHKEIEQLISHSFLLTMANKYKGGNITDNDDDF